MASPLSSLTTSLAFLLLITMPNPTTAAANQHEDLPSRLLVSAGPGGGSFTDCFNALVEIKSCTNEIILFFLNGEMYLGLGCCRAIRVITRQCWPSMLVSIGFTAEEGDILRGYCDATTSAPPQPKTTIGGGGPAPAPGPDGLGPAAVEEGLLD
ncbi:Egg cell-secreted protein 1.2 [Acorus gramineus]|uniref:Egg cell-secreted protein 1.2 n=1 Tax=Acorus gramineus TaxID=55184 RepID=A0AAV9AG37_ACOGR|nr:Egg cell-secreted protein 1.2 [Acorus gramineus]